MRRGNFRDDTVDYAAVGATQAPDLMHYPPERSIPAEESWRIGSGEARFQGAGEALMSWTAQRGAGLTVKDVRPASGPMYSGVSFDGEGKQCDLVGIAVPEGVSTRLGLAVYDEDKNECDPAETVATIEGEAFDLVNDGTDVWLTPLIDVFDVEKLVEPAATLTVAHGSLRASWQVMAMVEQMFGFTAATDNVADAVAVAYFVARGV